MKNLILVIVQLLSALGAVAQTNLSFLHGNNEYQEISEGEILFEKMALLIESPVVQLPFEFKGEMEGYNLVDVNSYGLKLFADSSDWILDLSTIVFGIGTVFDSTSMITKKETGTTPFRVTTFEFKNVLFEGREGEYFNYQIEYHETSKVKIWYGKIDMDSDHPYLNSGYKLIFGEMEGGSEEFPYIVSLDGDPENPSMKQGYDSELDRSPKEGQWYEFSFPNPNSIDEFSQGSGYNLVVKPNQICFEGEQTSEIMLYDLQGRAVQFSKDNNCLNVERSGVYIVDLVSYQNGMHSIEKVFIP